VLRVESRALGSATVGDCRGDCTGDSSVTLAEIIIGGSRGVDASACLSIGSESADMLIPIGDEGAASPKGSEMLLKADTGSWLSV